GHSTTTPLRAVDDTAPQKKTPRSSPSQKVFSELARPGEGARRVPPPPRIRSNSKQSQTKNSARPKLAPTTVHEFVLLHRRHHHRHQRRYRHQFVGPLPASHSAVISRNAHERWPALYQGLVSFRPVH